MHHLSCILDHLYFNNKNVGGTVSAILNIQKLQKCSRSMGISCKHPHRVGNLFRLNLFFKYDIIFVEISDNFMI